MVSNRVDYAVLQGGGLLGLRNLTGLGKILAEVDPVVFEYSRQVGNNGRGTVGQPLAFEVGKRFYAGGFAGDDLNHLVIRAAYQTDIVAGLIPPQIVAV
jgi:hypothetical protein